MAYGASAGDIAVISGLIVVHGGFDANSYVFYFPALLALSVAFRTEVAFALAGAAIAAYGLIAFSTFGGAGAEFIATRLLMLAAVAVCGNIFWRIERDRRRAAKRVQVNARLPVQPARRPVGHQAPARAASPVTSE